MNPSLAYGLFAFLAGSIPFGLLIARIFSVKDLRSKGSGNIGATNVSRVLGFWPAGFLTFLLDFLKGVLPVVLLELDGPRESISHLFNGAFEPTQTFIWFMGALAVLGHCFSPWLRFNGGKGVATGFGAILALSPISALIGGVVYGLVFILTGIGSISSLMAIFIAAASYVVFHQSGPHVWALAVIAAVIFLRHEPNIDLLLEQRERVF